MKFRILCKIALALSCVLGCLEFVRAESPHLYISYGSNLSKYTVEGDLVSELASDLVNAQGVAIDPSGNVFVADLGNGRIRMFDASGNFVRDVMDSTYGGGTKPQPFALAWNAAVGCLAATVSDVGTEGNTRIINFDVSTTNTDLGISGALGGDYEGLAYSGSDGGVLCATVKNQAQSFAASGPVFSASFYVGVGGELMKGIAIKESTTQKFVVDFVNNRVIRLDGTVPTEIVAGLTAPVGIAYSAELDALFVANWGANEVRRYTTTGAEVGAPIYLSGAAYLAVSSSAENSDNKSALNRP